MLQGWSCSILGDKGSAGSSVVPLHSTAGPGCLDWVPAAVGLSQLMCLAERLENRPKCAVLASFVSLEHLLSCVIEACLTCGFFL